MRNFIYASSLYTLLSSGRNLHDGNYDGHQLHPPKVHTCIVFNSVEAHRRCHYRVTSTITWPGSGSFTHCHDTTRKVHHRWNCSNGKDHWNPIKLINIPVHHRWNCSNGKDHWNSIKLINILIHHQWNCSNWNPIKLINIPVELLEWEGSLEPD